MKRKNEKTFNILLALVVFSLKNYATKKTFQVYFNVYRICLNGYTFLFSRFLLSFFFPVPSSLCRLFFFIM